MNIAKFKEILASPRFQLLVLGVAANFFSEVSISGYSNTVLFKHLALLFGGAVTIGTVDRVSENIGGK